MVFYRVFSHVNLRERGKNMITKKMKRALRKQCKTYANNDWLVDRLRLLNKLKACAEFGKIGVFTWGSDCDGVKFERSFTIIASVMEVINFERDYDYWADGAQYYSLHRPSELE
mgnify:CR=1 FL=1|jgi:hypothetical protein|tara:strand:- start:63 stop:404 length:342 start_codon:yes stop_codon:yes gene_type:complete